MNAPRRRTQENYAMGQPATDKWNDTQEFFETESQELATREQTDLAKPDPRRRFEPQSLAQLMKYSNVIVQSGLCPKHIKTPADALLIIQQGAELGLTAMASLQNLIVVNGKVGMEAQMAIALCRTSPVCEYFRCVESTMKGATWVTKRADDDEERSYTFDEEKRRKAGLGGNVWNSYPDRMHSWKAAMHLARQEYSEILKGLYSTQELEEIANNQLRETAKAATKSKVQNIEAAREAKVEGTQADKAKALTQRFSAPPAEDEPEQAEAGADTYTDDEIPFEESDEDSDGLPDHSHYGDWKGARNGLGRMVSDFDVEREQVEAAIASQVGVPAIEQVKPAQFKQAVETIKSKDNDAPEGEPCEREVFVTELVKSELLDRDDSGDEQGEIIV
jgi:hypothetical protein